jgi:hypothetical protein
MINSDFICYYLQSKIVSLKIANYHINLIVINKTSIRNRHHIESFSLLIWFDLKIIMTKSMSWRLEFIIKFISLGLLSLNYFQQRSLGFHTITFLQDYRNLDLCKSMIPHMTFINLKCY